MFWYVISAVAVLVILGGLAVSFAPEARGQALLVSGLTLIGWMVISMFFVWHSVNAGHVGLVKAFGAYKGVKDSGAVMTWPWQSVEEARIRNASHKLLMNGGQNGSAASAESQAVFVVATINYSLERSCVQALYENYGGSYYETIIEPRAKQIFKAETVRFGAVNILPNREVIRRETQAELSKQLQQYCVRGLDFLLENVGFGPEFEKAIEEKQVATQQALAAKNLVEVKTQEAKQAVETARGVAQSTKIQADADAYANRVRSRNLTPALVEWERIQKWTPEIIYLPSNELLLPQPKASGR